MPKVVEVPLEPLTAKAFAPFGQVIGELDAPPIFTGPHIRSWHMDFAVDGGVELMFARYVHQPIEFHLMERHFNVTQSFLPLGDQPSVMAVAAPTGGDERSPAPTPQAVRAFYVEGARGIMLWKATWHALTRFPARRSGAEFAVITGAETQRELERENRDGTPPKLTQVVDFAKNAGLSFKVVDPRGLLAAA